MDWQKEQLKDTKFVAIARELEPGYQIARLRIARGLTQAQLAEIAGTRQPPIACVESGKSLPSLLFLERIATVLNARVEIHTLPMHTSVTDGAAVMDTSGQLSWL